MVDTKLSGLPSASLNDTDEIYVNDGGVSKKTTIAALRAALHPIGMIQLPLTSLRTLGTNEVVNLAGHGGVLGLDSVPILKRTATTTDKSLRVEWALSIVDEVYWSSVAMPPDLDETQDLTIHLVAEMSGATDAPAFTLNVWDGVGDTEMGGATGVLADAVTEVTRTIIAANISGNPLGFLNIGLVPGAHGTDALYLYTAWIEYKRKFAT